MEKQKRWDREQLEQLIGRSESSRREFKSARTIDQKDDSRWVNDLTKEISAFANTEGGELFIGVEERQGEASELKGVSADQRRLTQIRDKIIDNVRPSLPGLDVNWVRLEEGEYVIVINVPKGNTAYQANDNKYYGRIDEKCVPLRDNQIRLLMAQGRVASCTVEVDVTRDENVLTLVFTATNTGGLSIRQGDLSITWVGGESVFSMGTNMRAEKGAHHDFADPLHPGQSRTIWECNVFMFHSSVPGWLQRHHAQVHFRWQAYLPDSPPCSGEIALADKVRTAYETDDQEVEK